MKIVPVPDNPQFRDLTGSVFSLWTVEGFCGYRGRHSTWRCKCLCGSTRLVIGSTLLKGTSQSCGCLTGKPKERHGHARVGQETSEYHIWQGIHARCKNPNHKYYDRYGGRGISVCERWQDFSNFLEDMGERPSKKHSINRVDNDGNYDPENCQWATQSEQCRNRSSNRMITYKGRTCALAEWEEITGIGRGTIAARLNTGWSTEDALTKPVGPQGRRKA